MEGPRNIAAERIPDAARRPDVIVIGGGVIGVCTTLFLQEAGARVTLLERGGLAAGASYGNAGWVFPDHAVPLAAPGVTRQALRWLLDAESPLYIRPTLRPALLRWLWRFWGACDRQSAQRAFALNRELGLASRHAYETLAAREGFAFGYRRSGLLLAFATGEGLRGCETELAWLEELGGEAKRLDAGALCEIEPWLSPSLAGGVLFPSDAHLDPAPFVHQAGAAAASAGAQLCLDTEVLTLGSAAPGVLVETTRGPFRAEQAVLAAGAWNAPLARALGCALPIEPAKGYGVNLDAGDRFGERAVMLAEAKVAVTPMGERLRLAGTLELAGFDARADRRRVGALQKAAEHYLPGVGELPHLETWRGFRPLSPDGLPLLGRLSRHPSFIVAGGHGMIGMAQGPMSGQLVAALASGTEPELDLTPFSPARFGA